MTLVRARVFLGAVVVVTIAVFPGPSAATPTPRFDRVTVSGGDISRYLEEARRKPGVRVTERQNCIYVESPEEWTLYIFTKGAHPAHPSVFLLHAREEAHGRSARQVWGHTAASEDLFRKYLESTRDSMPASRQFLARSCAK